MVQQANSTVSGDASRKGVSMDVRNLEPGDWVCIFQSDGPWDGQHGPITRANTEGGHFVGRFKRDRWYPYERLAFLRKRDGRSWCVDREDQ